ncbi:hypothetical protein BC629DRAFT_1440979 [Irpex lacteus]|nr:hypothetical protein BC629DRAFT_1440979 [Irpex lacteus]
MLNVSPRDSFISRPETEASDWLYAHQVGIRSTAQPTRRRTAPPRAVLIGVATASANDGLMSRYRRYSNNLIDGCYVRWMWSGTNSIGRAATGRTTATLEGHDDRQLLSCLSFNPKILEHITEIPKAWFESIKQLGTGTDVSASPHFLAVGTFQPELRSMFHSAKLDPGRDPSSSAQITYIRSAYREALAQNTPSEIAKLEAISPVQIRMRAATSAIKAKVDICSQNPGLTGPFEESSSLGSSSYVTSWDIMDAEP